ncbi:MAG: MFS transporter [Melioribacteraceae bacterium]
MKSKSSLTIIFLTVFIDLLGFGVLIPILPTFASKELQITDFEIGIVVAAFSFVQFIFNPILGRLSDRIGRRPIILVSLFITSIAYLWFSFADSFLILLLSRMLAGLGGSNISVAQAYIADITDETNRAKGMGLIGAAFGLGFVFGPMLGGMLSQYGYHIVGYVSATFSFMAFLFATFKLKESLKEENKSRAKNTYAIFSKETLSEVFNNHKLRFVIFIYFIIVFSMANIYGTFSLLAYKVYHFTDMQIGYLFGTIGIVGAIVQGGLIKRLSQKFKDEHLVLAGIFFMMLGLVGLPYGGSFIGVAIIGGVLAFGTGILQPTILGMVSKDANSGNQGSILGFNQSAASMARVLGPLWGGFAFEFLGYQFPFLTGGIFTFVLLIFTIYYFNSQNRKTNTTNV